VKSQEAIQALLIYPEQNTDRLQDFEEAFNG